MERTAAAAVIIGNEVLSAKVEDKNGPQLMRRLREVGVALRHVSIVPDEVDVICDAVRRAHRAAPHVFTSGGIGPTHDDVTVRAVAMALDRPVVRLPEMERLVREHYGAELTPETLRLADAPDGAELLFQPGIWYPVLTCESVYMLPGVPQLFRLQLETVLARLQGTPLFLRNLYLRLGEPQIAAALDRVAASRPHVAIGSYPTFDPTATYRVLVTVEHIDRAEVEATVEQVCRELPEGALIRVE